MNDRLKTLQKARQQQRLGTALRENLKRRKTQAKGRSAEVVDRSGNPHDSAGIIEDKQKRPDRIQR